MTELLERAIAKVKSLSKEDQDSIAAIILEEIENEVKWQKSFADSQDILAVMAAEAMAEYNSGKTEKLDLFL